jgi:hypothetical protein
MTTEMENWIVTGVAVVGLAVALWQQFQNNKIASQAHAREAWVRYLEHGFQHPEYGSTALAMETLGVNDVHELWNNETRENERYWWFLDLMMESCESLANCFPQREWKNTVKFSVRNHADAIGIMWSGERHLYSDKLCKLVDQVLAESKAERENNLPYGRRIVRTD